MISRNKSYFPVALGVTTKSNCRWFGLLQIDAWAHSVVLECQYWNRHYASSCLYYLVLNLGLLGFPLISFWFHRVSLFDPKICVALLMIASYVKLVGLTATDSQLHKLIHPWSLASLGTYTLFFLLTLLGAANTPVASDSFCFSSLAYCMVWPGEAEVQFHWEKRQPDVS